MIQFCSSFLSNPVLSLLTFVLVPCEKAGQWYECWWAHWDVDAHSSVLAGRLMHKMNQGEHQSQFLQSSLCGLCVGWPAVLSVGSLILIRPCTHTHTTPLSHTINSTPLSQWHAHQLNFPSSPLTHKTNSNIPHTHFTCYPSHTTYIHLSKHLDRYSECISQHLAITGGGVNDDGESGSHGWWHSKTHGNNIISSCYLCCWMQNHAFWHNLWIKLRVKILDMNCTWKICHHDTVNGW